MAIKIKQEGITRDIKNIYIVIDGVKRSIQKVYSGTRLVWSLTSGWIISCFGNGWWSNPDPWDNNDVWKNK